LAPARRFDQNGRMGTFEVIAPEDIKKRRRQDNRQWQQASLGVTTLLLKLNHICKDVASKSHKNKKVIKVLNLPVEDCSQVVCKAVNFANAPQSRAFMQIKIVVPQRLFVSVQSQVREQFQQGAGVREVKHSLQIRHSLRDAAQK
jgi:hypothetical protein